MKKLRVIGTPSAHGAQLISYLAQGLHAMAQPLTILRGALGAASLRDTVALEDRRYLAMSLAQAERLCDLLSNLRTLLDVAEFEPHCTSFDLNELLNRKIEDLETLQLERGVRIARPAKRSAVLVVGDPARTEQALLAALSLTVALSSAGDKIRCRIDRGDSVVRLRLQNSCRVGKNLSSADHLAVSIIEASMVSQQGECLFTEKPLRLLMTLPVQQPVSRSRHVTSECLKAVG